MRNRISLVLLFLLLGIGATIAQNNSATPSKKLVNLELVDSSEIDKEPTELILRPWLGVGFGNLALFSDITPSRIEQPLVSSLAFNLNIYQEINPYLTARFYYAVGKVGASGINDRRLYNLTSRISCGGAQLSYNFDHFLNKHRIVEPFITLGLEGFEFWSKEDRYDSNGNAYYYWSDGSIRNIDQASKEAYKSVIIHRDHTYETDLRKQNLDGFGKYPEFSYAIPFGLGINFLMSDKYKFTVTSTYHVSGTDLIDNISNKGTGTRAGRRGSDNFMTTSFIFSYNLTGKKELEVIENDKFINDLLADGDEDSDGDGVMDFIDSSAATPPGVLVNRKGIPYDNDKDAIFNIYDNEPRSEKDALVDENGVTLADSTIEKLYANYLNPVNYSKLELEKLKTISAPAEGGGYFKVLVGEYKSAVPAEIINKYLSLKDIATFPMPDSSVVYTTGAFGEYGMAKARLETVKGLGLDKARIVVHKDGKFVDVTDENYASLENEFNIKQATAIVSNSLYPEYKPEEKGVDGKPTMAAVKGDPNQVVYHVQVGAYKNKVNARVFAGVKELFTIDGDDGITRYMSGTFDNFAEAAKRKLDINVNKGLGGAFVTAYKGGKRISLKSAGVEFLEPVKEDTVSVESKAITKEQITFKIQLGVYKTAPPSDMKRIFDELKNVETAETNTGLTRYTYGALNDYTKAKELKEELINKGVKDAFIIAVFRDQLIDIHEALELLK